MTEPFIPHPDTSNWPSRLRSTWDDEQTKAILAILKRLDAIEDYLQETTRPPTTTIFD